MPIFSNQAFIDAQNLYFSTTNAKVAWSIDLFRFRTYLREKYHVDKAYYFIGAYNIKFQKLYKKITAAEFIIVFREHDPEQNSHKKGNVDTDIVFSIMKKIAEHEKLNKIILVSGDGDYFRTVQYLAKKNKLEKILAPNKESFSTLYTRKLSDTSYLFLDDHEIKKKIERKPHK